MEGRIAKIVTDWKIIRQRQADEAAAAKQARFEADVERVVSLLEYATVLPITIETTSICAEAKQYLQQSFSFTAASAPADDHCHSLWKIDVKD